MLTFEQFPITIKDILDILVVTGCFYYLLRLVKGTRAMAAINGFFLLFIIYIVAKYIGLFTLSWLLENFFGSLFLVIVILFSSDIRHALAGISLRSLFRKKEKLSNNTIEILADTCELFAKKRIGAIIVIERDIKLGDLLSRGVKLDALLSKELLHTIFFPNTALHDGAVIINKESRIVAASCVLPLTQNQERQHYGTRHRAALGLSEVSDSVVLVVSEERGEFTVAQNGRLSNPLNRERLERILNNVIV